MVVGTVGALMGAQGPGLQKTVIKIDELDSVAHLRVYKRCCSPPSAFTPRPVDPIRHL